MSDLIAAPSTTGSTEPGQASATPTQAQQSGITEKSDALSSSSPVSGLMDKFGLTGKLRAEVLKTDEPQAQTPETQETETEQPEAQAEEPTEQVAGEEAEPQGEAEPHEGEQEEGDEDETEGSEEDQQNPKLQKLKRKNYSLRKRAQKAEGEAYEWRTRAEQAEALAGQGPVVMPNAQDPLAHINNVMALEKELAQFEITRDWAEDHPEGWVANEGTPQEHVVTAEQAKNIKRWANGVLNKDGSRKRFELEKVRPTARAEAEKIMPTMFKRGTEDFEAAAKLHRDLPWLAADPRRDHLTAIMLRGFKASAESSNGNGASLHPKLQKAQQNRVNSVARPATPPERPSVTPNGHKSAEVFKGVAKAGGSREAALGAMRAFRNAEGPKDRSPATV